MSRDDDDTPTLIPPRAANDNGQPVVIDPLDARLLWDVLELLSGVRETGLAEATLFESLELREPDVSPALIRGAMRDARRSGFVQRRGGRVYLERRVTQEQVALVMMLARNLGARGAK
jgi:hypothetical protein